LAAIYPILFPGTAVVVVVVVVVVVILFTLTSPF
jgi:hypothetical protein